MLLEQSGPCGAQRRDCRPRPGRLRSGVGGWAAPGWVGPGLRVGSGWWGPGLVGEVVGVQVEAVCGLYECFGGNSSAGKG